MKLTVISDTHNLHAGLGNLSGEVLIHCGDMLNLADQDPAHLQRIDDWFGEQNFDLILCTGGNHDLLLEQRVLDGSELFRNAVYLQDTKFIHRGITFYGAPWTPLLSSHAFYKSDDQLREKWAQIPDTTDVLVTHTPPFGVLDVTSLGAQVGCAHLEEAVARIRPRVHCFGHVHNSAGISKDENTTFVNACSVNSQVALTHAPTVVEIGTVAVRLQATEGAWNPNGARKGLRGN